MRDDEIRCYGNACPEDTHLLAEIHCMNGEIYDWLDKHERRVPVGRLRRAVFTALDRVRINQVIDPYNHLVRRSA
jgi:hypothetical protein